MRLFFQISSKIYRGGLDTEIHASAASLTIVSGYRMLQMPLLHLFFFFFLLAVGLGKYHTNRVARSPECMAAGLVIDHQYSAKACVVGCATCGLDLSRLSVSQTLFKNHSPESSTQLVSIRSGLSSCFS